MFLRFLSSDEDRIDKSPNPFGCNFQCIQKRLGFLFQFHIFFVYCFIPLFPDGNRLFSGSQFLLQALVVSIGDNAVDRIAFERVAFIRCQRDIISELTMLEILSKTPPFSYMDIPKHRERIERVFTADNALKYVEFAIKAVTNSLPFEEVPKYADAVMLQRYTAVCGHLAYSLEEYQKAMLDFAEQSDGNEADRTAEGFAKMFGDYFPPEFSITEGNAWMSTLNNSVQYISVIRPGEKVAKLVKRMHYVSFVGMFRSDLFEGLCVGHAPKKCKICGKWFLTTNARHTKYCGGYAPGDKLHRTCRQIGNLKGREQRELADDHPIIQIYEKRLNTINRYVKRGTLDADLAEVMKKLAKDKELRAKSDVAYAKGAYEKEMEQAALLAEAKIHI